MLPKQAITFDQLKKEGFSETRIYNLVASLKIFPTPFKGVYYTPSEEERKATFIDKPLMVLRKALPLFLKGSFYYSCDTAKEFWGISWHPKESVHVVNEKLSDIIDLTKRIKRNLEKGTYRAKKVARVLSFYGREIIFHKIKNLKDAKITETPYGIFATKGQIRKDEKRFRCELDG
ncbi:hypothetical protein HYT84_00200 [Candidatus Micrarchaeota archaeon]|nr:hypothetical protein [Candidatus Micrarchaeota archaeon]